MIKKRNKHIFISTVLIVCFLFTFIFVYINSNNRLSEKQISNLREQYPICGINTPIFATMSEILLEDAIDTFDSFVYGEVIGESTTYYKTISTGYPEVDAKMQSKGMSNVYEFYEYTLRVIKDTEEKYTEGETITIASNVMFKDFNPKLSDGMKVVVPVTRNTDKPSRNDYIVVGMYYVTDEGYVISAFDESKASKTRTTYSGIKVDNLLNELHDLKVK